MFSNFYVLPLFLACSFIALASSQSSILRIKTVDQNGEAILNVNARLKTINGRTLELKSDKSPIITFLNLKIGKATLEVGAEGFKTQALEVKIKFGINSIVIKLNIEEIVEKVEVVTDRQSSSVDPQNGAFTNFLTKEQLASLPNDPEELRKELERQFGQNVLITVDGFVGGRLPPKSQIASIRITRSSFDAEYHKIGSTSISIISKAGGGKWNGSFTFNFNDSIFDARNPFSDRRLPSQIKKFDGFLSGPIIKNRTSFFLNVYNTNSYNQRNIVAFLPAGEIKASTNINSNSFIPWLKLSHNLNKTDILNVSFIANIRNSEGLGVGGFNLPTRAFENKTISNQLQVSLSKYIGTRFLNEFRFQYTSERDETIPSSEETSIFVLDAFNKGGAGNRNLSKKQNFWISNNLFFGLGNNHAVKIGSMFGLSRINSNSLNNQNGTFIFSNLEDFALNRPSIFTQSTGARKINVSRMQFALFFQDDVRIRKSFTASFGLRYELQNQLKDRNNFSPRLGFVWSPFANGKLTFRGGVGLYYEWLDADAISLIRRRDINQLGETVIINPSYPDPFQSGENKILPKSYWRLASDVKNPYVLLTSVGMEARIKNDLFIRTLYKYQKGVRQFRSRDINAPYPATQIRPNSAFGKIIQVESSAFFTQNSLNIEFNGRLKKDVFFTSSYTLGKTISDNSGIFGLPSDNYNLSLDRSVADNDQRHRFYNLLSWEILRNVRLSGIFTADSGKPYSITTGRDNNKDTIFNDRPVGVNRNSERGAWHKQFDGSISWTMGLVKNKKSDSTVPTTVAISASEAASGIIEIDTRYKYFLKFYVIASNIFNQTNLTNFVGVQTSPFFRKPTSAIQPRKINFGVRFSF